MTEPTQTEIANARLLDAMRATNPSVEKLMVDRFALRQEIRDAKADLVEARRRAEDTRDLREIKIPRYIGFAKAATLVCAAMALIALTLALFTEILDIKLTTTLFASLFLPILLVDLAERCFGSWHLHLRAVPTFLPSQPRHC